MNDFGTYVKTARLIRFEWSCKNLRRKYIKTISSVREDEVGPVFAGAVAYAREPIDPGRILHHACLFLSLECVVPYIY